MIHNRTVSGLAFAVLVVFTVSACAQSKAMLFGNDSIMPKRQKRMAKATLDSALITEAFATDRCEKLSRGGFVWFTDAVGLASWLEPLGAERSKAVMERVPLETHGALLVDFGSVPTPGHRINLVNNRLTVRGNNGVVQVDLVKSLSGNDLGNAAGSKKRPQMLTHPCSLFVLPRKGYRLLEVQTGLGDVLTSFENTRSLSDNE